MAQGNQQPEFERNPCIRFRDNWDKDRWTNGRRTNFDFMSSAGIDKQS